MSRAAEAAALSIDELERRGDLAAALARAEEQAEWVRASELALTCVGVERGQALAEKALAAASSPQSEIAAHLALARVYLRRHSEDCLALARSSLASAEALGATALGSDRELSGRYFKLLGLAAARAGHAREAVEAFAEGYRRADGMPALRARLLLTWAVQLRNWGLLDEAARRAERSLEIRLELGDDYGAAICHGTLAMIYGRLGQHERERAALAADLRLCERIGADAEIAGLRARLAGALIGLGKYASAAREADAAIEIGALGADRADQAATPMSTGFARRELARIALAQSRLADALALAEQAAATFEAAGNRYGVALCLLTECEAHLAAAQAIAASASPPAQALTDLVTTIEERAARAHLVFAQLGAIAEAAELFLLRSEARALLGWAEAKESAALLVRQVVPALEQTGLGQTAIARRIAAAIERLSPALAFDQIASRAALLRGAVAVMVDGGPQASTVVAAVLRDEDRARQFATSAIDHGAIVGWPGDKIAMAVMVGPGHRERGEQLRDLFVRDGVHLASGEIDIEPMWPAPPRIRGEAVTAALALVEQGGPAS